VASARIEGSILLPLTVVFLLDLGRLVDLTLAADETHHCDGGLLTLRVDLGGSQKDPLNH
jgi:hypothetical protein